MNENLGILNIFSFCALGKDNRFLPKKWDDHNDKGFALLKWNCNWFNYMFKFEIKYFQSI